MSMLPSRCMLRYRGGIQAIPETRPVTYRQLRESLPSLAEQGYHKPHHDGGEERYARVTQKKLFEDMDKFIAATEKDFVLAL